LWSSAIIFVDFIVHDSSWRAWSEKPPPLPTAIK